MESLNKKAQEDIAGFVVLLVVVMIILAVFLTIFISNSRQTTQQDDVETSQFLNSLLQYTTDCATAYEPAYSTVGELAVKCTEGATCTSGKSACEALNKTAKQVIKNAYKAGNNRKVSGYLFWIERNSTIGKTSYLVSVGEGGTGATLRGASQPLTTLAGDNLRAVFEVYFN
jgi:type II secretory pathway pseudopilin PulG